MNLKKKIFISFGISFGIFAICLGIALSSGFKFIELNFFQPSVVKSYNEQLNLISKNYDSYFNQLNNKFGNFVEDEISETFMDREVPDSILISREDKISKLLLKTDGLLGIRLIENDGVHLHFSTFKEDVLSETATTISYKNYTSLGLVDYSELSVIEDTSVLNLNNKKSRDFCKVSFDTKNSQLLFRYPLFDEMDALRGTFVFYVKSDDFLKYLSSNGILSINSHLMLVEPNGFVFGIPNIDSEFIISQIQDKWAKGNYGLEQILQSKEDDLNLFVMSKKSDSCVVSIICTDEDFVFNPLPKVILMIALFIILFLSVLLLFNVKQDEMLIISHKIKRLQYEFFEEYTRTKKDLKWVDIIEDISHRKYELFDEIKASVGKISDKNVNKVDALLENSWDEMLMTFSIYMKDNMIASQVKTDSVLLEEKDADAEELEEVEELSDADDVEDLEEISEVEEIEEMDEVEELEEIAGDEGPSETEETGTLEELGEAETTDSQETGTLEEVGALEAVEEVVQGESDGLEELEEVVEDISTADEESETEIVLKKPRARRENIKIKEISLEEFQNKKNPLNHKKEIAEHIIKDVENKFQVKSLDFSSLDN